MPVLYHRGGPVPCHRPALVVRVMPSRYELAADNVLLLTGVAPQRGDPMLCGSCGQPLHPQWLFATPDAQPITVPR